MLHTSCSSQNLNLGLDQICLYKYESVLARQLCMTWVMGEAEVSLRHRLYELELFARYTAANEM